MFAKKHGGTFILRIEDTDRTRFVEGATENLIRVLDWAGLHPDEGPEQGGDFGPYFQSQRTELYKKYAQELIEKGCAYYAFDTPEELGALRAKLRAAGKPPLKYNYQIRGKMRNSLSMSREDVQAALDAGEPYVIRLLIPQDRTFEFDDIVRGHVSFAGSEVDDQVLIKSDGFPTYHLANVVDDHLMQISHVIRGEEWLSSVPKHVLLYECLGWQPPKMAHLPLIFNPDGSKMSKRDIASLEELPQGKVDADVETYIKAGYEKEAIINYIALLGWNPGEGEEQEVFSLPELVERFSLERVNKSAAIFDLQKLNWINSEHIARRDVKSLAQQFKPELEKNGLAFPSDEYLEKVVGLLQTRLHFSGDFIRIGKYFFRDPDEYEPKVVRKRWKDDSQKLGLEFCDEISKLDAFTMENIEAALRQVAEKNEVGGGRVIHPVRLAVTGVGVGPGLFEILQILGKEAVIRRLKKGAEIIPGLKE